MNSFRCPSCGFTNFADSPECKRCKNPLDQTGMPAAQMSETQFALPPQFASPPFTQPQFAPQFSHADYVQPEKPRSKTAGVALAILVFMLTGFAAKTFVPQLFGMRVEDKIIRLCSELNKKMPMMVDSETRLDNVSPLPGKSFSYNYTLVNLSESQLDVGVLKAEMTPQITNRALTLKEVQPIFDDGVTVIYKYFDKNGKFLFEIPVKKIK